MKRFFLLLIVLIIIAFITFTAPVYAGEKSHSLSVNQIFVSTTDEVDSTFHYRLRPLRSGLRDSPPMPPGSNEEGYDFYITGNRSERIGPFVHTEHGVHRYEIFQVLEEDVHGYGYNHDRRKYKVEIYINDDLDADIIVSNDSGMKTSAIAFQNEYYLPVVNPEEPDGPDGPGGQGEAAKDPSLPNSNMPKTGDDTDVFSYIAIMILSGISAVCFLTILIKKYLYR